MAIFQMMPRQKQMFLLWFVYPFANRFFFFFFTNISIPWALLGMEEAFIALLHFSPNLLNTWKDAFSVTEKLNCRVASPLLINF